MNEQLQSLGILQDMLRRHRRSKVVADDDDDDADMVKMRQIRSGLTTVSNDSHVQRVHSTVSVGRKLIPKIIWQTVSQQSLVRGAKSNDSVAVRKKTRLAIDEYRKKIGDNRNTRNKGVCLTVFSATPTRKDVADSKTITQRYHTTSITDSIMLADEPHGVVVVPAVGTDTSTGRKKSKREENKLEWISQLVKSVQRQCQL